MNTATAVLIASTVGAVAASWLLVDTSPGAEVPVRRPAPRLGARGVAAAAVALAVFAASGWLVPSCVVAVATWFAVGTAQRRDRRAAAEAERTDAIASWIENLRDVLVAGDQPLGAVTATVATCPAAIRPAVRRLAAGLGHQDPDVVLRRFADDLDDPLGDLVAAGLLVAIARGARTVAVLGALAEQARRQADRRRLLEAERAPIRREVTLLAAMMGALVVGLLVFGRAEYLAPYDRPGGQVFLGFVLAVYALLLLRVQRLARFPRPGRFLTHATATRSTTEVGAR